MSETIKIEIEIPAPPDGWGEVEYRLPQLGESYWNGEVWSVSCSYCSPRPYPVARKIAPPWTPPPELVAVIKPGWVAMDENKSWWWHPEKPELSLTGWVCRGECASLGGVKLELLPTNTPWHKCCFKIGDPQE